MSLGVCQFCGRPVQIRASFVHTGPTDPTDPAKPRRERFVPVDEDIHGWTPFVMSHPTCYAHERGVDALLDLVDQSHRSMRARHERG